MREYQVEATWDNEAELYIAKATEVAGFIVGGRTQDDVLRKVRAHLPDFLDTGFDSLDEVRVKFDREKAVRVERLAA